MFGPSTLLATAGDPHGTGFAVDPGTARSSEARLQPLVEPVEAWWRRALKFVLVLLLHGLILVLILYAKMAPSESASLLRLDVRTVDATPIPPTPKPKLQPPPPPAKPVRPVKTAPPPVMVAVTPAPASTHFAVAPQPPAPPVLPPVATPPPPPAAPAPPVAVTAARFDADYLHNPAPGYPPISRRMHEEGRVLLLVRVTPQGTAESVAIRQSSGSTRLDEAAQDAVRLWRFVPARRGDEAIAASVVVPIVFRLDA